MAVRRLSVEIVGSAKGAQKAFGDLEKASGRAGKKTESSLSKANKALIGFGAGAAIYGAFSAFDEAQKVTAQTEAVLKSTGGAANVTAKEIEDLAGALSKKSGVDDEAIQSGSNLIATFTGIRNEAGKGNDVFAQTTAAALDMSVAMGTDMKSASMLLGKALNDPAAGLARLTKVGVTFTAQQKEQIKSLSESGDKLGAQKMILEELNKEFGGSAEAQATALGKAKVSVDNMAESVGGALAPALEVAASGVGALADAFSAMPESMQLATLGLTAAGIAALKWGDAIGTGITAMKSGVSAVSGFGSALGAINTLAAERGLSRIDTLLNVLDAGGNKKTASTVRGVRSITDAVGGMAGAATIGATATVGFSAALVKMQLDSERAKNNMKALQKQIESGMSPGEAAAERLANTLAGVDGGFEGLRGSSEQFRKNLDELGLTATDVAELITAPTDEWDKSSKRLLATQGMNKHQLSELVGNIDMMRESTEKAAKSDTTLVKVQEALGVATGGTTTKQQEQAEAYASLAEKATAATAAIKEHFDAQTAGLSSQIGAEAALDQYAAAIAENGRVTDINTEAGRRNQQALIDAKEAALGYAMTLREQPGGTQLAIDAMNTYSLRLVDTWTKAGYTKTEIASMQAQMGLTPGEITTTFQTNATEAELKIRSLTAAIREMSTQLSPLGSSVLSGTAGRAIQVSAEGRASGGDVMAGGFNLVGERGPELVQWGASGTVIPAGKTKQMLSGTSVNGGSSSMGGAGNTYITVQVQGNVYTPDDLVDAVKVGLNKQTRRDGRSGLIVSYSRAVVG